MTVRPFISYAREDRQTAEKLYHDLAKLGAAPWIDVEDLLGGQNWELSITRAIRESSHFLAVISQHSVNKRGFVQREIRQALEIIQQFPPDDVFVVPVRLDETRPRDERLSQLHWVDLFPTYEEGFRRLAKSLGLATVAGRTDQSLYRNRARKASAERTTVSSTAFPVGQPTLAIVRDVFGVKSGWVSSSVRSRGMFTAAYVVTNITNHPIKILRVEAQINDGREAAAIVRFRYPGMSDDELETIPSGGSRKMAITFFGAPVGLKKGRDIAVDIAFVDQFGNENWMRDEKFRYVGSLT